VVRGRDASGAGFTLLELIAVMFIISVLAGIALPRFQASVVAAREAVLAENLYQLRDLIDQYYIDKGRYPETLDALVEAGYLRKLPKDPFTGQAEWDVVFSEPDASDPGAEIGIFDVHSLAPGTATNGQPYAEW
jgi:general secretion pathway protein G